MSVCRRRLSSCLSLIALACVAGTAVTVRGQIVLNGPNVSGTVGLANETFSSASVDFNWPGGNVSLQLLTGDNDFSVRVEPDRTINATVGMFSFQNATNAYVYQQLRNLTGPSSTATSPLQLDFSRPSGRIVGRIAITGGSVVRVDINASKTVSANESYTGYASTSSSPFDAVLPFIAAGGVAVQGTAVLRASRGCDVPVTLSQQSLTVPAGGSAAVSWTFDLTNEPCNQASIQGHVTYSGLDGPNADAVLNQRYVQVSGAVSRSQFTDAAGSYFFSSLPPGSYYVYNYAFFNAPYSTLFLNGSTVALSAGQLLTRDFTNTVGTVHAAIRPRGAWSMSAATGIQAYMTVYDAQGQYVGQSYDQTDATGKVDFVVPAGLARMDNLYAQFFRNDGTRSTWQYLYNFWFHPAAGSPLQTAVSGGARLDLGVYEPETSESLLVVQPSDTSVGLSSLRLWGFNYVRDSSGRLLEQRYLDLTSQAIGTPQNSVAVLVRGVPGTFQMTASGQGTDGATYSKQFELVLGAPTNTPAGAGVVAPVTIVDQTSGTAVSGSITFGNVTTPGETTVSASGSGPKAPGNFKVIGPGSMLFYDIQTTATFDPALGATLCLNYDDSGFTAGQEQRLTLHHYVCANPQNNTGCDWQEITSPGYPDTAANRICGVTSSFSIFAIMERLDQDGDGIADGEDNCPAVRNADQRDFDGDGLGDLCDADLDGDLVDDTADNCTTVANPQQQDLDTDGIGDACDPDADGDSVANDGDNCRVNANATQADFDGDGLGDACDIDDDNDGIVDADDSCAGTPFGAAIVATGCSSAQQLELICPTTAIYRNHGQYVQCVAHVAEEQMHLGLITVSQKDAIVATAAKSEIGKK